MSSTPRSNVRNAQNTRLTRALRRSGPSRPGRVRRGDRLSVRGPRRASVYIPFTAARRSARKKTSCSAPPGANSSDAFVRPMHSIQMSFSRQCVICDQPSPCQAPRPGRRIPPAVAVVGPAAPATASNASAKQMHLVPAGQAGDVAAEVVGRGFCHCSPKQPADPGTASGSVRPARLALRTRSPPGRGGRSQGPGCRTARHGPGSRPGRPSLHHRPGLAAPSRG